MTRTRIDRGASHHAMNGDDAPVAAQLRNRAVVIGASIAGLLAARVLADYFAEVVLVERDTLPTEASPRKGVPQSSHVHVLLVRGAQVLDRLFPGFIAELTAAGAQPVHWPSDVLWLSPSGWGERTAPGMMLILATRDFLEHEVRRRVIANPRVRVRDGHDAIGLLGPGSEPAGSQGIRGVHLRSRDTGEDTTLDADLVVDASGRTSRAPQWLAELGYPAPQETVINSFLGYASRMYDQPRGDRDWKALFFMTQPPRGTRAGVVFPVEGGRWHVTLIGVGRDYPPTDEQGFLEFARSLRSPLLAAAIEDARPLTKISGYRRTENQLRRYDELRDWPEHFVVLGDAACSFNPVYGQGMSTAGESALVLDAWLRANSSARDFQVRLRKALSAAWLLATGEDFRYPTTEGGRPNAGTRLIHRYLDRILATATTDDVVADAFLAVVQMVAPPVSLFAPRVFARTLRGPTGRRRDIASPPAAPGA
jgi:2-polyprenyl-6-methoxyphenol hydroxylase-like FAD-dependent oxidoreductase